MCRLAAPVLTNVATFNIPVCEGISISILGLNFASADPTVKSSIDSASPCGTSAWSSMTALQCLTPASTGNQLSLAVAVGALVGTSTAGLTFDGARSYPDRAVPSLRFRCSAHVYLFALLLQRLCLLWSVSRTRLTAVAPF